MSARAQYDAVVVGAGPNGLAASIALARAGRGVLLLEAAPRIGGAVATEELTLPGFRHDVFSSVYPAGAASPVFARMPLDEHGLRWIQPELPMAHPLPDGAAALLSRDLDATVASLDALAPGDGARWRELAQPYLDRFDALRATMLGSFPPVAGGARLLAGLGLEGTLEFTRLLFASAESLGGELFGSDGSKAWLFGSALHGDVPVGGAGSAISGLYLALLGHAVGWPSPEGGAGRLAQALGGYFAALGGETRTGARVTAVDSAAGRVSGVTLHDGIRVGAPIVILDTTPHALVALAGAALPAQYVRKLVRFRYGQPTLKLDWALDAPIPWEAPDVRRAGTVHVGGTAPEIRTALLEVEAGRLPARPFLLLGQQSLADPTRAPAGKHTAWAYTHVPAGVGVDAAVAAAEAQIERFAPGFGDAILARHVLAPPQLEDRNANLVGGDVGGGSYALDQLVFRPLPSLSPYRTPLPGLYLGSASTFPGGAVHGVPGDAAARAALMDAKLRRIPRPPLPRGLTRRMRGLG
ncbi:NAD(P)/FAD-dependent oxidoreductase [Conexibacter sp. CPCC 206217]|uniref:phytoene desaturase family protein n=1 Tax=Conexibacter sp. CPCC 206217 TaxID=3064574 RepID=UPI00271E5783|nr:NAD(P)/FAD-dependent oxidoreductase [Conexibacter sp. CPCC 206217]MDO8214106.1 NAD(P)/FAD-dependent oxidoreductase [Conexibacter sp. CPCC 206217]